MWLRIEMRCGWRAGQVGVLSNGSSLTTLAPELTVGQSERCHRFECVCISNQLAAEHKCSERCENSVLDQDPHDTMFLLGRHQTASQLGIHYRWLTKVL